MKTLDEVIKDNKYVEDIVLREEILKSFESNISNIKNECIYLIKESPNVKAHTNVLFVLIDDLDKKFHSIYYRMTSKPKTLKDLFNQLKSLKINFEKEIYGINRTFFQIDHFLNGIKQNTQSGHANEISDSLKKTVWCYKDLLNTYVKDEIKLNDESFKKEIFGNEKLDFLEAQPNKIIIRE